MNPSAPETPEPASPGVPRALAAYAALALAALGVTAVSLGLAGQGPAATASVTAPPVTRPLEAPAAVAEAPAPPVRAGPPAPPATPVRVARPIPALATASTPTPAPEPTPAAAPVAVPAPAGVVEHRVEDGLGGRGRVRWTVAPAPARAGGGAAADAAGAEPAEADLTTRPIPEAATGRLETGSFFGLPAGRRTVYLIDASGSLIDTLAFAQRALREALLTLDPSQSFAVLFFLDGRVVAAPPGRMAAAERELTQRTASYVSPEAGNVFPAGRADAAAALEAALAMDPDVVVLLSDHVEGRLDPERTRAQLVGLARGVAGATAIHTVQFVDEARVPADGGMATLPLLSALTGGTHRFVGFASPGR